MNGVIIFVGCFIGVGACLGSGGLEITPREDNCFEWVHNLKNECFSAYFQLSNSDRNILDTQYIPSEGLYHAMTRYVTNICAIAKEKKITIPAHVPFIIHTMLKIKEAMVKDQVQLPVGPTTSRIWAYKVALDDEDHLALQKDNYIGNPQLGNMVWKKYATAVVDSLEAIDKNKKNKRYIVYYENKAEMIKKIAD